MERIQPTEQDGYDALRGHLVGRADACREKYGIVRDQLSWATFLEILRDTDIVRFPVEVVFTNEGLMKGEFAIPRPNGEKAGDGFQLLIRPCFEGNDEALVTLALYHIPSVNYLDIVTHVEAELFGAAMLGIEIEDYYQRVCRHADRMPAEFCFTAEEEAEAAVVHQHLQCESEGQAGPASQCPPSGCSGGSCG